MAQSEYHEGEKNPVWETMTKVERRFVFTENVQTIVIRVWRQEDNFALGPDREIVDILNAVHLRSYHTVEERMRALVFSVKDLPRIADVEVLVNGQGVCHYPDWY
jgi:hypothetical protein